MKREWDVGLFKKVVFDLFWGVFAQMEEAFEEVPVELDHLWGFREHFRIRDEFFQLIVAFIVEKRDYWNSIVDLLGVRRGCVVHEKNLGGFSVPNDSQVLHK